MNTLNFEERTLQEATANVVGGVDRNVVDSIFIRIQDHFRKILFSDILYIEASGSYCTFYLQAGAKATVAYTLTDTMQHLSKDLFIRVHRSYIVNKNHVVGLSVIYFILAIKRSLSADNIKKMRYLISICWEQLVE